MMCVKCGQVRRFLIKVDAPEATLSIQLTEACSTVEPMRNLEVGSLVVLSNNGLFSPFGLRQIQREPSGLWR